MKYLVSFRTTLRISRYLFRALALLLWTLGAVLPTFFIISVLHDKESSVRQEFASNYSQAEWYVRHSADVMRELKYITENRLTSASNGLDVLNGALLGKTTLPQFTPLFLRRRLLVDEQHLAQLARFPQRLHQLMEKQLRLCL
nr:Sensor kinase protein RcsC [Candidatus Pantoea persica]